MQSSLLRKHPISPGYSEIVWLSEVPATKLASPRRTKILAKAMDAVEPVRALFGLEECQDTGHSQTSRTADVSAPQDISRDFRQFFAEQRRIAATASPLRPRAVPEQPPDHRAVQRRLFASGATPQPVEHQQVHRLHLSAQDEVREF